MEKNAQHINDIQRKPYIQTAPGLKRTQLCRVCLRLRLKCKEWKQVMNWHYMLSEEKKRIIPFECTIRQKYTYVSSNELCIPYTLSKNWIWNYTSDIYGLCSILNRKQHVHNNIRIQRHSLLFHSQMWSLYECEQVDERSFQRLRNIHILFRWHGKFGQNLSTSYSATQVDVIH